MATKKPTTIKADVSTKRKIINPMSEEDIEVEMAKTTHTPYMTVTLNGKQYIGKEDGTLILKPSVFQTKTLYDVVLGTETTPLDEDTDKVKLIKVTKDGVNFTRIEHWKYDATGKSVYINDKTKKARPQARMNIPGGWYLVSE
jgi:hypothetical protein